MSRPIPSRAPIVLFTLFFLGFAVTLFSFFDLHWTHWLMVERASRAKPARTDSARLQRLRQSILNVRVTQCGPQNELLGTGFVVKSGFVATAAHVLGNRLNCSGAVRLVDYKGRELLATVEGVSDADDLAVLGIPDTSLPPLSAANATTYESPSDVVKLATIDAAATPGEGTLSRFDREHDVFVTSGLNLNAGNSGGPVFVRDNWTVLGIARAKLPNSAGDDVGFVASIHAFENFFHEKTGQEMR